MFIIVLYETYQDPKILEVIRQKVRERENFARNSFQLTSFRGIGGHSERTV